MLIKDKFTKVGSLFFKYRGYQYILYGFAVFLNFKHFNDIKTSYYYDLLCLAVVSTGLLIRAFTIGTAHHGTSGRNTREQAADQLNTTGTYSIVRNPLYIGNLFVLIGTIMTFQDLLTLIYCIILFFAFYIPVIFTEEDYLQNKFGEKYSNFANNVNALLPSFSNYKKPENKFSLIKVLLREHDTLFTAIGGIVAIEVIRELFQKGEFYIEPFWKCALIFTLITWSILKYHKKYKYIWFPAKESS